MDTDINWGYNCLTSGIHHGRPEPIWNLPLFQAVHMFDGDEIKDLVVTRIYRDAMQFVEHGRTDRHFTTPEWASKIKILAEELCFSVLYTQIDEITKYYESPEWHLGVLDVISRVKEDTLNPHYKPLHSHDSINMLCRILGTHCSRTASAEISES